MTIQLHTIADHAAYQLNLYNLLVKVEDKRYGAYVIANLKTGVLEPHIGVGFKITEDPALREVILAFGINPTRDGLTTAQQAKEIYYRDLIRQKVKGSFANDAALQSALDQIMYNRSIDTVYNGTTFNRQPTFRFNQNDNDAQLKDAFNEVILEYEGRVDNWLGGDADSYETIMFGPGITPKNDASIDRYRRAA